MYVGGCRFMSSVASARTEVGDDGYDDFGVKKKKVKATKAEREAAALARLHQSYRYGGCTFCTVCGFR